MHKAKLHKIWLNSLTSEAYLGLCRLEPGALVVLERGDRLGELEEHLALHAPLAHALAAAQGAAGAPVGHDEAEREQRKTVYFISSQ